MTRRELIRWAMWDHERSALMQQARLSSSDVWSVAQVGALVAEGYPPWLGEGWDRPIAEAAMELAAIGAGFLDAPMAEHLGERLFFPSSFDRDAWLTQHPTPKA